VTWASQAFAECRPVDFDVSDIRWVRDVDGEHLGITGTLRNNCGEASGAKIILTLRDAAGNVITTHEMWPDSVVNLPARTPYQFSTYVRAIGDVRVIDAKVLEVKAW
jgi:hypothetical protein